MILLYFTLLLLAALGLYKRDRISLDASLEMRQTNVVKGFFILWVFLSHIIPHIRHSGYEFYTLHDRILSFFDIGQNVVIMFLFYSGYGIHRQLLKRGDEYLNLIPRHRILNTLINFDVAVLFFLIIALFLGTRFTLGKTLLSFTGWESLGNSNWYIFDIIVLYGLIYLVHIMLKETLWQWLAGTVFVLLFTVVMHLTRPEWWWDTILCFWGGYSLSCFQARVQKTIEQHWWIVLTVCIVVFGFFHCCLLGCWHMHHSGFIPSWMKLPWLWLNLKHLSVAFGIILLTMRIGCQSKPLEWCGEHLFPIYIYQRLPMMAIPSSFIAFCPIGYVASCLVVTLCIAAFYKYWQIKL